MSTSSNEVIQDIAIKHGIVLSKDDPILILQTMNDHLTNESQNAQIKLLTQFKEEMEHISSQWKEQAKEKAEKILNASLCASKEAMTKLVQESNHESIEIIKKMLADSLLKSQTQALKTQRYCVGTLFTVTAIFALYMIFMMIK